MPEETPPEENTPTPTPPHNLPNILSLAQQPRQALTDLATLQQKTAMLCALSAAQNLPATLTSGTLPDGTGGTATDQPVPVLDNLTTAQLTAALDALATFNTYMTTPTEEEGTPPIQTALALMRI